jgi:hypothetical protein
LKSESAIAGSRFRKAVAALRKRLITHFACSASPPPKQIDKGAALKTYQKLLDLWKSADSDFIPAQEARAEMTALNQ